MTADFDAPHDPIAAADPTADGQWLRGRGALVTGAGLSGAEGGVGHAIARVFARHGAVVAVLDRDPKAADRTVEAIVTDGGSAFRVDADATGDEDCRRAVAQCAERFGGRLDLLVNNVASGERSGILEVGTDDWDRLMDVNLKSAWLMTRHAERVMADGSAIVNISSVGARTPGPGMVYSVAKAGLENLTKGAASTLGPRGIRVNCVQIGAIWSSMAARNIPAEARESRRRAIVLGTEGTPWDPAYAALFLASDKARWISGHILSVEGGGMGRPPR
ncbi:SDR family NAD(P)-dependent oxidoreductase [Streptomyces odontomachi]|uniref:SDR family NAD(P)-dependent oxidoreductase n=1 Tax=Streptomyces odontomachi TaxID=2944940 RepID=UPI00210E8E2B|nr:SDR family oxidoreductase [Streptomyces sp. ODS25]